MYLGPCAARLVTQLRSTTAVGLRQLAKMQFRRSLYFLHRRRTRATVCRHSPNLQRELVTSSTHQLKKKPWNSIFLVCNCISSALCRLVKLWRSWSTILVGVGVCLYVARLLVLTLNLLFHSLYTHFWRCRSSGHLSACKLWKHVRWLLTAVFLVSQKNPSVFQKEQVT